MKTPIIIVLGVVCVFSSAMATYLWLDNQELQVALRDAEQVEAEASLELPPTVAEPPPPPPPPVADPVEAPEPEPTTLEVTVQARDELAAKDRMIRYLQSQLAERTEPQGERRERSRFSRNLQDLRERDPERYAELQERMRNFTKSVKDTVGKQHDFLSEIDTSLLSEENRERFVQLQEKLGQFHTLTERLSEASTNDESTGEIRRELFTLMRDVRPLLETAREASLLELGAQLGYPKGEEQQFVDYVKHVYDMTSGSSYWRSFGRGGSGRGGSGRTQGGQRTATGSQPAGR